MLYTKMKMVIKSSELQFCFVSIKLLSLCTDWSRLWSIVVDSLIILHFILDAQCYLEVIDGTPATDIFHSAKEHRCTGRMLRPMCACVRVRIFVCALMLICAYEYARGICKQICMCLSLHLSKVNISIWVKISISMYISLTYIRRKISSFL